MTLSVTHAKNNNIANWTQADLNAQIALGNFPPGTVLADIVLPSDWNSTHTVSGSTTPDGPAGGDLTGTYPNPTIGTNKVTYAKFQAAVTGKSIVGKSTIGAGNFAEIAASDPSILRRDDTATTAFGFGTLNLAVTGFFVNQLQPGQGGLGNGTWTERSIPFFEGGVFTEDNTGDNQFIYKRTFGANGQLSLGSNHSFGIGTVYDTFSTAYSRGTIFADGGALVPGASTSDLDMTLYITGAAAAPNVSGNYAGAGLRYASGNGANNSNADEGIPSEAGSVDWTLGSSGAATGENRNNGANGPHFGFKLGSPGTSESSDVGQPSYFVITGPSDNVILFIDAEGGGTLNSNLNMSGSLNITGGIIGNSSAGSSNDFRYYGDTDSVLFYIDVSADSIGMGTADPTSFFDFKAGTTSRAPAKLTTGNLKSSPAAGSIEYLAPWLYFTGNTTQDKVNVSVPGVNLAGQTAAITATTAYAVPSAGASRYLVTFVAKVTTAASVSSVLGGANGFQIKYTDANDSVVVTTGAIANTSGLATNLNTTQATYSGTMLVNAKASTNIQYLMDYTSAGTAMAFNLKINIQGV